jgi:alkaline phosphatase D
VWTRATGLERSGNLRLEIAADEGFDRVVHRGFVQAARIRDFTARATVRTKRLQPGERHWYRFETATGSSPVGRFTTARPADSHEPLRIGFWCCQDWKDGLWPAHFGLAAEKDLDLIIGLGDYVYESGGENAEIGRKDDVGPDRQAQTLDEWRQKYRLYLTEPSLRAMHASAAYAAVWDDHEAENDYEGDKPGSLAAERRRVSFEDRKRNGYLAFFEYGPRNRIPQDKSRIYRRIRLGGTADILMLDTRQYRDAAGHTTILGGPQREWLKATLSASKAPWKVLANQVMMMSLEAAPGVPLNPDQWDGYPADRADVLGHVRAQGIEGVTVVTGDIHTFFAGDVYPGGRSDGQRPPATEFVGGAISSTGLEKDFGDSTAAAEVAAIAANAPHLKYAQLSRRGYGVLELTPDELRCTFRSPTTVKQREAPIETLAQFRVGRREGVVERA